MPNRSKRHFEVPDFEFAERGVYVLPWVGREGERHVVAINRRMEMVMDATVYPPHPPQPVVNLMYAYLDREDPEPRHLTLLP